jgi:hypothetical protein
MSDKPEVPTFAYPPIRRSGVVWGLSGGQVGLAAAGVVPVLLVFVQSPATGLGVAAVFLVPWLIVVCGSWRRRTLLSRLVAGGLFMFRKLAGQTRFVTVPGETLPAEAGVIQLPGALRERLRVLSLVTDRDAGDAAFLWDKVSGEATVVLWMTPRGWAAADVEARMTRTEMFAEFVRRAAELGGIARVGIYARTLPQSSESVLTDYRDLQDEYAGQVGSGNDLVAAEAWQVPPSSRAATADVARADYEDFLDSGLNSAVVRHDVLLTLTLNTAKVSREIARLGGEVRGVSEVLQDRVMALVSLLPDAGIDSRWCRWCTAGQLRAHVRAAIHPVDVTALDAVGWELDDTAPLVGALTEARMHLEADGLSHRVLWIQEWPRLPREAGFLDGLVSRAAMPHTVTLVFTPVPVEQAEVEHRRAVLSHESALRTERWAGRPPSPSLEAEGRELAARQEELGLGFGNVEFRGFVTVAGRDSVELSAHEAALKRAAAGMRLETVADRQWAAFQMAGLPLGIEVKK